MDRCYCGAELELAQDTLVRCPGCGSFNNIYGNFHYSGLHYRYRSNLVMNWEVNEDELSHVIISTPDISIETHFVDSRTVSMIMEAMEVL